MTELYIIAHNIRSAYNVGSLLRTAEGLGVSQVILSGYTPYPQQEYDERLPHLAEKISSRITKTSLGAEKTIKWTHESDVNKVIGNLTNNDFTILGLEQAKDSISLPDLNSQQYNKIAILLGSEVEGLDIKLQKQCHQIIEIPMAGNKESFNVIEAATMVMYQILLINK